MWRLNLKFSQNSAAVLGKTETDTLPLHDKNQFKLLQGQLKTAK